MAEKAAGIFPCTVLSADAITINGSPEVQISVKIDDGPDKGQMCTYEDQVNAKSALYVGRSCKAIGWAGKDLKTLSDDCNAWIKATGGKSTVEIRHFEIKRGKKFDKWVNDGMRGPAPIWDKVNSIGRAGARAGAPLDGSLLADANDAMRSAMAADTGNDDDGNIPF